MKTSKQVKAFGVAVVVSALLPFIPVLKFFLLPFDYFNTHLHEFCHALAAVLTGGHVYQIHVFASSAGVTNTSGGFMPVITMAGYLGSSLIGSAMIYTARSDKSCRNWLFGLAALIFFSNIFWVRGDIVGWPLGVAWGVIVLAAALRLKGDQLLFATQFLAAQQCLNAFKSLRDLILLSGSNVPTDAQNMADATHIPAVVWALLWTGISLIGIISAVLKMVEPKKQVQPA